MYNLVFLSRSHTISNTYILRVASTPYRQPHNTPTICTMPLQSILEAGLHSRQSFLARLTYLIRRFLQPERRPRHESYKQITKANIDNSSQQELLSYYFCDHISPNTNKLWLLLCYLRVRFQLASPPGFHFDTHPEG